LRRVIQGTEGIVSEPCYRRCRPECSNQYLPLAVEIIYFAYRNAMHKTHALQKLTARAAQQGSIYENTNSCLKATTKPAAAVSFRMLSKINISNTSFSSLNTKRSNSCRHAVPGISNSVGKKQCASALP